MRSKDKDVAQATSSGDAPTPSRRTYTYRQFDPQDGVLPDGNRPGAKVDAHQNKKRSRQVALNRAFKQALLHGTSQHDQGKHSAVAAPAEEARQSPSDASAAKSSSAVSQSSENVEAQGEVLGLVQTHSHMDPQILARLGPKQKKRYIYRKNQKRLSLLRKALGDGSDVRDL